MPGYRYAGTVHDTNDPWPELDPRQRPGRKREDIPLAPCGTPAAYRRHIKRGEPIDDACRDYNIQACREYRQRKKADA